MKEMDGLKEQVMMNQFMFATGCPLDQAKHFLTQAKWQFEVCIFRIIHKKSNMALVYILDIYKQRLLKWRLS